MLFAGALGYIGLVDPHRGDSLYPQCPFKLLTGWNCPACGGLRMTHDLLHGDVAAAINDNVFLVFLLAGIPVIAGWLQLRRRNGQSWLPRPRSSPLRWRRWCGRCCEICPASRWCRPFSAHDLP
ncbi:hypothetical protein I546_2275 [Mycobacterium kansasii 732]|nr:hypothetical protein I546_2275 [Mycobacterium kansasii 732]